VTYLSITARCVDEDLESPALRAVAALLTAKFLELRGQAPDAGESISSLRARDCRSLQGSRYRGVTWHDREHDIVWLLAAHIHRDDSHDDSYAVAAALEDAGRLYPTMEDYAAFAGRSARDERAARTIEEALALQVLRDRVLGAPTAQHQSYTSQDDLYVEMWAERVPELALLILRIRMFRRAAQGITDQEVEIFREAIFAHHPHKEVGDQDGRYQRFEGLIAL